MFQTYNKRQQQPLPGDLVSARSINDKLNGLGIIISVNNDSFFTAVRVFWAVEPRGFESSFFSSISSIEFVWRVNNLLKIL